MAPGDKEGIIMLEGISRNLDISKRMRGIGKGAIEAKLNSLPNCQSIDRAAIMTFLALSVQRRSGRRIGSGPANAAASQCI